MVDDLKNKLFVLKAKYITNSIIFVVWFLPIFFAPQFEGFVEYGFGLAFAKASYVIPVLLGVAFITTMILLRKNIPAIKYGLTLLLFIYGHALLSDIGEYVQVLYFSLYALVVHLIGYNFPKVLFRQYFTVCRVIVVLVIVDYLMYYTLGYTLFYWHELGEAVSGVPRIHTFFNESFHQASFLMPALLYRLFGDSNRKGIDVELAGLLLAYLATLSAGAILLLIFPLTYYIYKRKINFLSLFVGVVVSVVVIAIAGDYIVSKLSTATNVELYQQEKSITSGANYIAMLDIAKNTKLADLVFGVGYFNVNTLFADYLTTADLYSYYLSQGFIEGNYTSNTLVRLLYSFGLLGGVVMWFLVKKMFRSSRESLISTIIIVSIILLSIKESHALDDQVFIFFLFGLFWGENWRSTKKTPTVQFAGPPNTAILN